MNLNNALKWIATVVTIIGALAVANNWDPLNIYMLNISSVLWLWWAVRIRELSIVVVNVAMLAIYAYGLLIRM
jgi:hypothetical protein